MRLIFFPLLLSLSVSSYAAEWKSSSDAEVKGELLYNTAKVQEDPKAFRGLYTGKLGESVRYGRQWKFRFSGTVQGDPDNVSKSERLFWDVPEAYLQYQRLPFTLQMGMNTYLWGDTDVVNPIDVLNARRYQDPLRSEKLGAPSISVKNEFGDLSVEAVYIPKQRKTLLPGENSRWLPRDVYKSRSIGTGFSSGRLELPSTIRYYYLEPLELDHALSHNLGLRLKWKFSGFDWSLVAYEGVSTSPMVNIKRVTATATSLYPELTIQVNPDIQLQAAYYKVRVFGTSFVWVLGDFLVKGVSAYTKPVSERADLPRKAFENALGLERSFSVGSGTLTALLQGSYADHGDALDTNSTSLSRMFDRAGMLGLRYTPTERLAVLLSALGDFRFEGELFHGEVSYSLSDTLKAGLSGDVLGGKKETPLGTYRANDRMILSLSGKW